MRIAIFCAMALLTFTSSTSWADPVVDAGWRGVLSVEIPFGGPGRSEGPEIGLRVHASAPFGQDAAANTSHEFELERGRVALFDVRFSPRERNWTRFNVGGLDALTYRWKLNQYGPPEREASGVNPVYIAAGIVVGGGIAIAVASGGGGGGGGGGSGTDTTSDTGVVVTMPEMPGTDIPIVVDPTPCTPDQPGCS